MSGAPLPLASAAERLRGKPGRPRKKPVASPAEAMHQAARLLDVEAGAAYLGGISTWTMRDLIDNGTVPRVRVPMPGGGELRRILVDREDLDRLIEAWKDRGQ